MSSRFRLILTRVCKFKSSYKAIPASLSHRIPVRSLAVPYTLGFSLFTWLGFEKKLSAEDELINTIKHCILFIQRTEYEKAEQLLHVALRQAQQMQHQLGVTYVYDVMANLALEREQLEKAKKLFISVSQRIMTDGATEDDLRVVHIGIKLARISHLQKEYNTAQIGYDWGLEKLNKAYSEEPSEGLIKLIAMTEDWYGRLFLDSGQGEHALKLMTSALERMRGVSDIEQEHLVVQLNDLATVCEKIGKNEESIAYLKEAIELGKKLDMEDLGTFYVNLGRVYMRKQMFDEARKQCGFGWKLGVTKKNDTVKEEAALCLKQIKNMT